MLCKIINTKKTLIGDFHYAQKVCSPYDTQRTLTRFKPLRNCIATSVTPVCSWYIACGSIRPNSKVLDSFAIYIFLYEASNNSWNFHFWIIKFSKTVTFFDFVFVSTTWLNLTMRIFWYPEVVLMLQVDHVKY